MGLTDKLGQISEQVQSGLTNTTRSVTAILLNFFSSAMLGLTLSLIVERLFNLGTWSWVFCWLVFSTIFFKMLKPWRIRSILVFDLVVVLVLLLARMYIVLAP